MSRNSLPIAVVAVLLVGPGCRDTSAPAADQCNAGYGDACLEAALDARSHQERRGFENKGQGLGNRESHAFIRTHFTTPWGDFLDEADKRSALHAYAIWCSRGKVAACYELGNWLAFDFASPAAAVSPYMVACDANFEDACDRAKQARFAAERLENKPMPDWMGR